MNPITKEFLKATIQEQEEFCIDKHRVICRIVANKVENSWCGRVLQIWKEKMAQPFEKLSKKRGFTDWIKEIIKKNEKA